MLTWQLGADVAVANPSARFKARRCLECNPEGEDLWVDSDGQFSDNDAYFAKHREWPSDLDRENKNAGFSSTCNHNVSHNSQSVVSRWWRASTTEAQEDSVAVGELSAAERNQALLAAAVDVDADESVSHRFRKRPIRYEPTHAPHIVCTRSTSKPVGGEAEG